MSSSSNVLRRALPWLVLVVSLLPGPLLAQVPGGVADKQKNAPPRGLADTQVAMQNGAFTSNIKIELPAFRSLTPSLQLGYSSSGGNEFAGVGWDLYGFSSIERVSAGRGSPPTSFSASSYLLDGEELIPHTGLGGTHATLRQSYLRIREGTNWTVTRPDGTVMTYTPIFSLFGNPVRWGLTKTRDVHGNEVTYSWFCDQNQAGNIAGTGGGTRNCYPGSISYAGVVVTINRETRPDVTSFATGSSLASQRHRLKSIVVTVNGVTRASYALSYTTSVRTGRSLLTRVQQFGRDGTTALPPTTMAYADTATGFNHVQGSGSNYGLGSVNWTLKSTHIQDFNGDGRKDVLVHGGLNSQTQILYGSVGGGFQSPVDISNSYGLSTAHWDMGIPTFGDFNGDGRTDIILRSYPVWVTNQPKRWSVHLLLSNPAGGFHNQQVITNSYGLEIKHWEFSPLLVADYNGDGKDDIIVQYKPPYDSLQPNPARAYMLYGKSTGFDFLADDVTNDGGMTAQTWFDMDVIPADFNGDGLADLYMKNDNGGAYPNFHPEIQIALSRRSGDQFAAPQSLYGLFGVDGTQWSNYGVHLGDYNGDGRTDFLFHRRIQNASTHPTGIIYSQGSDTAARMFSTIEDITTKYGMTRTLWQSADLTVSDFNDDGISDILVKRTANVSGNQTFMLFSNGAGYRTAVDVSSSYGLTPDDWTKSLVHTGDFDGDGDADLFLKPTTLQSSPQARLLANAAATGNVINTVANGYGGTTTVVYEPSSHWLNSNNPPISQTVSAYIVTDGRGQSTTTVYDYAGGAWDPVERRHLGFRYVKKIDPTNAYTETYFYQGASFAAGEVEDYYEKNAAGLTMRRTYRTVMGSAAAPWIRNLVQEDRFDCNGDASCRQSRAGYSYDAYGNTTLQVEHGDVTVAGDERSTVWTYFPNATVYITGAPASVTVYQGATGTGTILNQSLNFYDSASSSGTPPTKGNLTSVQQRKDAAGAVIQAHYGYDAYGNRTTETDARGHTTTTQWGTTYGLYPSTRSNALQHTSNFAWEPVCGLPASETDANGAITAWTYDNFCRKTQETRADGGHTQWFYVGLGSPTAQHVREEVRDGSTDDLWNVTYFDGLGRSYRTVAEGGATVDTVFDARGQTASVSAPYAAGETPRLTTYSYDALGRTTQVTHPDASFQRTLYGDWSMTTCDELGKPRSRYLDAYGQVVLVREYLGKACELAPAGTVGSDIFETRIGYDLLGRRVQVTNAKGHVTSDIYDMLGRRTRTTDPDMGTWQYGYDDNGNLVSQTDARAVTLLFTYDVLNRLTVKRHSSGAIQASYFYDEPEHGYGIGRRSRVTYYRGTLWYNYDALGRVTDQYRQIGLPIMVQSATEGAPPPGSVNLYHTRTTYDVAGRVQAIRYPTGEIVNHGYDAAGRLTQVGGYVTNATYDARGNLLTRTLGNGAVESFEYDANRLWLLRSRADKGGSLHNTSYGRNVRGEVTSKSNALVAEDQWTFAYDELRRLTQATATANPGWSQDFAYDALGRITSQTGRGDYSYPIQGSGPVHAPSTVGKKTFPPTPTQTFFYDANGQLTQGGGVNISYDYEGRAAIINDEVFGYDADGELVTHNSLRFVPKLYEEDLETSTKTNFIYFGETRIARNRGGVVTYYHGDQIGTVSAITNAAGSIVSRKVFSPYGQQLLQSGSLGNDVFGMAAQRVESNGLYHMGARRMHPGLGIFTLPDPSGAPDPTRPQSLNRFAYANNSPVNLIDPSGYAAERPNFLLPSRAQRSCEAFVAKSTCSGDREVEEAARTGVPQGRKQLSYPRNTDVLASTRNVNDVAVTILKYKGDVKDFLADSAAKRWTGNGKIMELSLVRDDRATLTIDMIRTPRMAELADWCFCETGFQTPGLTDLKTSTIYLNSDRDDDVLRRSLAHELGHYFFGEGHPKLEGDLGFFGIMKYGNNVNDDDRRQFSSMYAQDSQ